MDENTKGEIGLRLRRKREQAGYTREELGELCSLSPRFIANVELGDSTFSLDSLITVCNVLSCSSDEVLFGNHIDRGAWNDVIAKLQHLDIRYREPIDKLLQGFLEAIVKSKQE